MDSTLLSALIAAAVSSLVALVGYIQMKKELRNEKELLERQLQRNLTEKLYELRLSNYPPAFKLTEALRSELLFSGQMNTKEILSVRNELILWADQNSFFMSEQAIQAFYDLRRALNLKNEKFSNADARKIFEAKKRFRGILRSDVNLLYIEEQESRDQE